MNRRGFFRRTLGTLAGAALTPLLFRAQPTSLYTITPEMQRALSASMKDLFNPPRHVIEAYYAAPISMRYTRVFELSTDHQPARLDVLYGVATLRPDLAVRIAG